LVRLRERRKLSVFNKCILWLHYFVIVSLLVAVASKYISPLLFWIPAFFGLAFPFLFLLDSLLIIYWLIQFKPAVVFGIISLCISLPTAYRFIQISFPASNIQTKQLKVTSFNCMLFDLYDWKKNKQNRSKILTSLSEINPDILCLQEFYTSELLGHYNNIDTLKQILKTDYFQSEYTTTLREYDHWGIATFSKYPIINQGKILFNTTSNNVCIYSDIVINKDTLRVYNIHLQSIRFSKGDNKFLEDVVSEKNAEDEVEKSKNILRRLKRAFLKRTKQVDMIVLHMKTCRYKVIVCGDFNDTAASYTYQKLSKKLNDAFIEKGLGIGTTYAGKWPQFRIDYILHSKNIICSNYKRSSETFTDHYPITAYFDKMFMK
jgi:endonuclease/exonuclease/phosphatase family metal-dependent hydrolase